ncbi:MAG: hypothetical protein NT027_07230 [Proteobacteria bacterium]|nr:hypothetical protein [Pseudomonadota bacterium]
MTNIDIKSRGRIIRYFLSHCVLAVTLMYAFNGCKKEIDFKGNKGALGLVTKGDSKSDNAGKGDEPEPEFVPVNSEEAGKGKDSQPEPPTVATPTSTPTTTPSVPQNPLYAVCTQSPTKGKQGYGKCKDNHVVVTINDGRYQEMTCCPLPAGVLSSVSAEKHVARSGTCNENEVATGMQTLSSAFCTKIVTEKYKLSAPITSTYATPSEGGVMGIIARSYHRGDTCICKEGYVAIGGHSSGNNHCADKCVRIEKK